MVFLMEGYSMLMQFSDFMVEEIRSQSEQKLPILIQCKYRSLKTKKGNLDLELYARFVERIVDCVAVGFKIAILCEQEKVTQLFKAMFSTLDTHYLLQALPNLSIPNHFNQAQLNEILSPLFEQANILIISLNPSISERHERSNLQLRSQIQASNDARRHLASLAPELRVQILTAIASELEQRSEEILQANQEDLRLAELHQISSPLIKRLKLTQDKLHTLATGIRNIAHMPEPIGRIVHRLEVSPELLLERVSTPIGSLLVIFESRPDSLPQIAALSLKSGNNLILKGGKEAEHSNACLHRIITETIERVTQGKVSRDVIKLVTTRNEINQLLALDDLIDLVIPRGSNELVRHIQTHTKIPVLGHADGVCHVYVDKDMDLIKAQRVIIDAKINYPAACNAMETLLIHESLVHTQVAQQLLDALAQVGVKVLGGPKAIETGLISSEHAILIQNDQEDPFHVEYGDLVCTCEVVQNVEEAIEHCHKHGSHHTECILTENPQTAARFLNAVDSACVFHNASTRFADGFRLGLGAEVGISTSRIHARGPVGIEGLLTTKWLLRSQRSLAHTVTEFSEKDGPIYTHRPISIED